MDGSYRALATPMASQPVLGAPPIVLDQAKTAFNETVSGHF
jgi:hypothetical protein